MLVGPPASLKTSTINKVFNEHYDALVLGDINVQTLVALRDDLRTGRYSSFAFTEFEKLYQRRSDTASNIEGIIKQLVDEGFGRASFEDHRMATNVARSLVVGAMTNACYERHFRDWIDGGFARRFLWCNITVQDSYKLTDSLARWELLDLGSYTSKTPGNKSIPMAQDTDDENHKLRIWLKNQPGEQTPFILLKKILSVLKWKYAKSDPKKPISIMKDFSECLTDKGAMVKL
jgi:hypothetical protein